MKLRKSVVKAVLIFSFLSLVLTSFPQTPFYIPEAEAQNEGNIRFQPNIIPFVDAQYASYSFTFSYKSFFLRVRPYFGLSNGSIWSLQTAIIWLKARYPTINLTTLVQKLEMKINYGFNVTKIPTVIANNLEWVAFKLVDWNFPLSYFELETFFDDELGVNITRINIPKIGLTFSFEDLFQYGYTVSHMNQTWVLISNIKGKTDLYLDPITYSSPTITVIGFTEASPCTFWYLWNASNTNGWNVVWNNRNNNTQFQFDALIVIGDSVNSTWFADTNKQITLNSNVKTGINQKFIYVKNLANVIFGTVENLAMKRTKNGIDFVDLSTYDGWLINAQSDSGVIYIYSSSFKAPASSQEVEGKRIWNVIGDEGVYLNFLDVSTADIFNLIISGDYGIRRPREGTTIKNVYLLSEYTSIWFQTYNGTLKDVYARSSSYLVRVEGTLSTNNYLINVDGSPWTIQWINPASTAKIWRKYEFDLTLTGENNNPVANRDLTITYAGQGGGTVFTGQTNSSGQIPTQTLTMGFYNQTGGNTIYSYNPYTLTITAGEMYKQEFTLDEKKDWTVAIKTTVTATGGSLQPTPPTPTPEPQVIYVPKELTAQDMALPFTIGVIASTVVISLSYTEKKRRKTRKNVDRFQSRKRNPWEP